MASESGVLEDPEENVYGGWYCEKKNGYVDERVADNDEILGIDLCYLRND